MKILFKLMIALAVVTASFSLQAASPWEFEYWFTPTGSGNNTPEGVNLRIAPTGGPNLGSGQGNGGGNNNRPPIPDGVDPVVTGPRNPNTNTNTNSPQTFESQWVAFAGINKGGNTQALVGGVEIKDATLKGNKKSIRNNGKLTFTFAKVTDVVNQVSGETKTLTTKSKVPLITSVDQDTGDAFTVSNLLSNIKQVNTKITGFDGKKPSNNGSADFTLDGGRSISKEFINQNQGPVALNQAVRIGGDLQVYGIQGTIKDKKGGNKSFGKNNFFVPEGTTNNQRKQNLTYNYYAGYTTSSADIAKLAANVKSSTGRYNGSNDIYNIALNIDFKNQNWGGTFTHKKKAAKLSLNVADGAGTLSGSKFTATVAPTTHIQSASVIGNVIGSQAQRAIGATTATYTKAAPKAFAGKTEQSAFSLSQGKVDCDACN